METYEDGSIKYDTEIIVCECDYTDHNMIYTKFDDSETGKEVYFEFCLNPDNRFFRRLKLAFRYLFKRERTGNYGEIIITKNNMKGFEDIVNFLKED